MEKEINWECVGALVELIKQYGEEEVTNAYEKILGKKQGVYKEETALTPLGKERAERDRMIVDEWRKTEGKYNLTDFADLVNEKLGISLTRQSLTTILRRYGALDVNFFN